ncbi:MAG: hypothetical protein GY792_29925, partial [Gammaproteobacteria bacterium]|nr:hypothetical protein [Gammaproteobacteria bacterium]MCP4980297.1 hypothetical protein [Gammaproteobacteria bacterium]
MSPYTALRSVRAARYYDITVEQDPNTDRVTVELKREDGKTVHVRKATRPEPRQQVIYDALGISDRPGNTEKTI